MSVTRRVNGAPEALMPYLVVGFGLLMSVVGIISISSGWQVIQVERGWSLVIGGTTLLAGGFVTAALGVVLRAVEALRTVLPAAGLRAAAAEERPSHATVEPMIASTPAAVVALAAHGTDETVETRVLPPEDATTPVAHVVVPPPPDVQPIETAHVVPPEPAEPEPAWAPQEAEGPTAWRTDPPASTENEQASPAMDDWLDRGLADIDHEHSDLAKAPTEPELPPEEAAEPSPTLSQDVPHPAPSGTAVIGRYESEGTSYVMYADGSIEAQSPAGVYRFASMAELKAFIES